MSAPDSAGIVAQGLHELGDRRLAADLGIDLGPVTEAEVAAATELRRTAAELGIDLGPLTGLELRHTAAELGIDLEPTEAS